MLDPPVPRRAPNRSMLLRRLHRSRPQSGELARATVFHKAADYDALLDLMAESSVRTEMRIFAYCLMPNHFHLALWPREDGDLSRWMHWLMSTHVSRHLRRFCEAVCET